MELVIRIALMFFFIQFLVVVTVMAVALLLAMPEVPIVGSELDIAWLGRSEGAEVDFRVAGSALSLGGCNRRTCTALTNPVFDEMAKGPNSGQFGADRYLVS